MVICRSLFEEKSVDVARLIEIINQDDYYLDYDSEGIIIDLCCVGLGTLYLAVSETDKSVLVFSETETQPTYYSVTDAEAETLLKEYTI